MKKTLIAFTFASLFIAGIAQAMDHSATVEISGSLNRDTTECTVYADSSLILNGKIEELIDQGQPATAFTNLNYSIGDNGGQCIGKIALQLHGVADDADGTALANSETGETAAKGVAVGLFNTDLSPMKINDNKITPTSNVGVIKMQLVKLNGQTPVEGAVHASLTLDIVRL